MVCDTRDFLVVRELQGESTWATTKTTPALAMSVLIECHYCVMHLAGEVFDREGMARFYRHY